MTARTDYFRNALFRAEASRVLLSKLSSIPLSNDRDRMHVISSAKDMQSNIQMNLARLAITKPKSWHTQVAVIDRDFKKLEDTLQNLWTNPLDRRHRKSAHADRPFGN